MVEGLQESVYNLFGDWESCLVGQPSYRSTRAGIVALGHWYCAVVAVAPVSESIRHFDDQLIALLLLQPGDLQLSCQPPPAQFHQVRYVNICTYRLYMITHTYFRVCQNITFSKIRGCILFFSPYDFIALRYIT